MDHPAVREAAVIAIPDERGGETPAAYGTCTRGRSPRGRTSSSTFAGGSPTSRHRRRCFSGNRVFRGTAEKHHRQGAETAVAGAGSGSGGPFLTATKGVRLGGNSLRDKEIEKEIEEKSEWQRDIWSGRTGR
ncbi:hypothetical protein [Streptomyces sp. CT34]|uniref:AMP-binding enzyme n=1 Tax=Streptomyces sp. CT34 TaxID=1553907 RepID=UPI0018E3C8E8|nr:hypothetical protein [Streptomyces sp. CT34]